MNGAMPKQEPVRHDFSKIRSYMALPNLIDVQRKSYDRFLQMNLLPEEREDTGLQSVFTSVATANRLMVNSQRLTDEVCLHQPLTVNRRPAGEFTPKELDR